MEPNRDANKTKTFAEEKKTKEKDRQVEEATQSRLTQGTQEEQQTYVGRVEDGTRGGIKEAHGQEIKKVNGKR